MKNPIQIKNTILSVNNPISRSLLRRGFLLIPLAFVLAWLALLPIARAVLPAPEGGYANFNTAEGDPALFSLTTGFSNTAIGVEALLTRSGAENARCSADV